MENVTLVGAFLAGLLSFLSPCVLPMLPTFSAILAGGSRRPYVSVTAFLAGFTTMFILMGATASFLGQFLFEYQAFVRKAGALLIILMGLFMIGLLGTSVLNREYRPFLNRKFQGPFGAFLLGMAFTVGWTPCTGPILATILIYAGESATIVKGALLLFIYALGFSLPFFCLTVVWNQYLSRLRNFYDWLPKIQIVAGVLLVLLGIAIWFNWLPMLIAKLWIF